jgi:hypothetical protein
MLIRCALVVRDIGRDAGPATALIDCVVRRVLFDFERAEMGLDLHFEFGPDGIAAVSLSCVCRWHSPRVPTEAASTVFESA